MRLQPIVLTADALHVRCGLRWKTTFPWAQIEQVRRAKAADKDRKDTLNAAVMGEPQLMLICREPVLAIGLFGRRRMVDRVGLTVDEEPTFVEALRVRGIASNSRTAFADGWPAAVQSCRAVGGLSREEARWRSALR